MKQEKNQYKDQLKTLDYYEGTSTGLFKRVKTEIFLKDSSKQQAFIYVPTDETILSENLSVDMDRTDRWKEEIKKFPEIIKKFPELLL